MKCAQCAWTHEHRHLGADKNPVPRPKRVAGFLACDSCKRTVPYQGYGDPDLDMGWPQHRCTDHSIRPFTRWSIEDPSRQPIREVG